MKLHCVINEEEVDKGFKSLHNLSVAQREERKSRESLREEGASVYFHGGSSRRRREMLESHNKSQNRQQE